MTTIFLCLARILIAPAGFWPRPPNPRRHPYLKKHTHHPSYSDLDLLSVLEKLLFLCIILCYIDGKVSLRSCMPSQPLYMNMVDSLCHSSAVGLDKTCLRQPITTRITYHRRLHQYLELRGSRASNNIYLYFKSASIC